MWKPALLSTLLLFMFLLTPGCFRDNSNPLTSQNLKINWTNTHFPVPGNLSYTFFDEIICNSSNDIFVSLWSAGLFRSTDRGNSWQEVNTNLTNHFIDAIAINSREEIFAGAQNVGDTLAGIFSSSDNGNSWIYVGLQERGISSLCIDSEDRIFAGGSGGRIFRSTDDGENWEEMIRMDNEMFFDFDVTSEDHILAGCLTGIYRSLDHGVTWEPIGPATVIIASIAVTRGGVIVASSGIRGEIFRSKDQGENWEKIGGDLPTHQEHFYWHLQLNSEDRIFAASWFHGIYHSQNLGTTWKACNEGLSDIEITALGCDQEGYVYAGTGNTEIFRTVSTTLVD